MGQPDFDTPVHIERAACESILSDKNLYTSDNGIEELRIEVSALLNRKYGCRYSQEEILLTLGASEAINLAIRALVDEGDEAIVFDPVHDAYCPCILLSGNTPRPCVP